MTPKLYVPCTACRGVPKRVVGRKVYTCDTCVGTGTVPACKRCKGAGMFWAGAGDDQLCTDCDGSGAGTRRQMAEDLVGLIGNALGVDTLCFGDEGAQRFDRAVGIVMDALKG